ncbi:protein hunchback-like [Leptinotarsa decemlineata]|uniref:protein hunchback-like n=1 Tax=Leptinotarsa decemlineata TaxID=7539 RepID=UPI003D304935
MNQPPAKHILGENTDAVELGPASQTNMDLSTRNELGLASSLENNGNGGSVAATSQPTASMPSTDICMATMLTCDVDKKNSRGKLKTYKCKRCPFVATTKTDIWSHSRIHMKEDKVLTCPKCPFVTDLKHHLEYHMRNHDGSKPYKCSQCDYSCVNNSMLISHKKSHSNIYQFSCADCKYATKYCHSLKLHLRKYKHTQEIVLNADGTPNPSQVIDVYGTKRGPKVKQQNQKPTDAATSNLDPIAPFSPNPLVLNANPQDQDPRLLENLKRQFAASVPGASQATIQAVIHAFYPAEKKVLSMPFMVEPTSNNEYSGDGEDDGYFTTIFDNVEVVQDMNPEDASNSVTNNGNQNSCQFCGLTLGDPMMYTIHMGYHGFSNPFTATMTPDECRERLSIQLHLWILLFQGKREG